VSELVHDLTGRIGHFWYWWCAK